MATIATMAAGAVAVRPASKSYSDLAPLRPCSCKELAGTGCGRRSLVVEAKGKGARRGVPGQGPPRQNGPSLPKLEDDGNPKFVLFVSSKNVPRWYPLSVVSGGNTAKIMIAAMGNSWGRKLYQGTLTRNIASVIYKDERKMKAGAVKTYPVLKAAAGLDYGYKIWDKDNPNAAFYSTDVVKIPPKEELKTVVDKVKEFFGSTSDSIKESFGSITNLSFSGNDSSDEAAQEESSTSKQPSSKQPSPKQ